MTKLQAIKHFLRVAKRVRDRRFAGLPDDPADKEALLWAQLLDENDEDWHDFAIAYAAEDRTRMI